MSIASFKNNKVISRFIQYFFLQKPELLVYSNNQHETLAAEDGSFFTIIYCFNIKHSVIFKLIHKNYLVYNLYKPVCNTKFYFRKKIFLKQSCRNLILSSNLMAKNCILRFKRIGV